MDGVLTAADPAPAIRSATAEDLPFLWEMLVAAASAGGDPVPVDDLRATPELARYLEGWGRPGDAGLVAFDGAGESVGACWYRTFAADDAGYGFVDEATPELAIACIPTARGRGLGHRLIREALAMADAQGHRRLSLSVLVTNRAAIEVYEDCGFRVVGHGPDGDDQVMVARSS